MSKQERIDALIKKLELLYKKQETLKSDINSLKLEFYKFKSSEQEQVDNVTQGIEASEDKVLSKTKTEALNTTFDAAEKADYTFEAPIVASKTKTTFSEDYKTKKRPSNLERYIGENLLNKIGILITIIGVIIGAKYSIENNLISPLTRIILGYFTAIGLLLFGIKLKSKYEAYSAVLVSGSIVILYFITFFAYSFYDLIHQMIAFALMVLFTIFTVIAAISYNRQIIAHLGLVGAYAIPFLLSNNSGSAEVLFSYVTLINIGVLIIAFKKYWKPLYLSAFGFTWLIFISWCFTDFDYRTQITIGIGFLFIFFTIFYITFLAYKTLRKETLEKVDILILLLNAFIFYGFGYGFITYIDGAEDLVGLFTLINAIIHFAVALIIKKQQLKNTSLFYMVISLVLVFIAIAIPVQLDGNWVTLCWAAVATILFWIGRTKQISIYEKLSYPLMLLAFLSQLEDWQNNYSFYGVSADMVTTPIFNINFLSAILFICAFIFICRVYFSSKYANPLAKKSQWKTLVSLAIPVIMVFVTYNTFRLEIASYYNQLFYSTAISYDIRNYDLKDFKIIWILNYSLLFVSVILLLSKKYIKEILLFYITQIIAIWTIFIFLVQGLYVLSELRAAYLDPSEYFNTGIFHLIIRYISFLCLFILLFVVGKTSNLKPKTVIKMAYDIILHITLLWVLSSELIHWMDIAESQQSYKLGLSLLWGFYSFLLITFGILKNKKHLRIASIVLFGVTLIKLFFYDLIALSTISKTIVFVSLGILLLIMSFLYNKYKNQIYDEVEA